MHVHGDRGDDTITAIVATGDVNGDAGDDEITLTSFLNPRGGTSAAYGGLGDDRITANGITFASLVDGGGGGDIIDCGFGFDRYAVYDGDTATSCELPFTPSPGVNGGI